MVCYIDDHAHLDYYKDIDTKVENAKAAGVGIIVNNGTTIQGNRKILEISNKFPEVKAALGIYPTHLFDYTDKELDAELKFIESQKGKIIAIGEVGMDFKEEKFSGFEDKIRQRKYFTEFVKLSIKLNIPIIVHSRKAELDCIEILEKQKAKKVVMHCFSGKFKLAKRIVKNGWLLSIPATVTYAEQFQKLVKEFPMSHLTCETDSPYLHPVREERGPTNEPANVVDGYKAIAKIKGMDLVEVKNIIYMNYMRFYE